MHIKAILDWDQAMFLVNQRTLQHLVPSTAPISSTAHHCRYWIGYTQQSGNVADISGNTLRAVNSSRSPYLHYVQYDASATSQCVAASPRHAYHSFEWW